VTISPCFFEIDALSNSAAGETASDMMRFVTDAVALMFQEPLRPALNGVIVIMTPFASKPATERREVGAESPPGSALGRRP
jgi:hypothetical protein